MKIGILTYHHVTNDGSVMQAYCLQQLIKNQLPESWVEIIDYYPVVLYKRNLRAKFMFRQFPFLSMQHWKKQNSLKRFINNHFFLSPKFRTDNLEKAKSYIIDQTYDAIIVGSDTVWEVRENGGAPLAPNIYFLPTVENIKKIAFAVSLDQTDPNLIKEDSRKSILKKYISNFDFISVRDVQSFKLLLQIGIHEDKIQFLPDPTLLYDFSDIVQVPKIVHHDKGCIAGIAIADDYLRKYFYQNLTQKGYRVVSLLGPTFNEIKTPLKSLNERLGAYALLDLLITDRFHGSIFALKLGTCPIVFVEKESIYSEENSKGRELFHRLGIEEMVWRYSSDRIPNDLIDGYLEKWNTLSDRVIPNLKALRRSAQPILDKIFKI